MVKSKELGLCSAADRDRYDRYFYGATSRLVNGIPLPKTVVEKPGSVLLEIYTTVRSILTL